MGLLHGDIAVARCVCRTPRLCRDIPRYAPVTPDRFYDNLVDNNLNSFHSDQRAQAKKIRIQKAWYGTGTISRLYTYTIHAWEVFWSGGITMPLRRKALKLKPLPRAYIKVGCHHHHHHHPPPISLFL